MARRDMWRWRDSDPCPRCGEWIGHWGGDATREPCPRIPQDTLLEELRPNCYAVRRPRIGDAIRAAEVKRAHS
jgi:hypothetical protein